MTVKHMTAKHMMVHSNAGQSNHHNPGKKGRGDSLGSRGYMREHSGDERKGANKSFQSRNYDYSYCMTL